jgi:hypothetical protein
MGVTGVAPMPVLLQLLQNEWLALVNTLSDTRVVQHFAGRAAETGYSRFRYI